jgi:hypothetical protein
MSFSTGRPTLRNIQITTPDILQAKIDTVANLTTFAATAPEGSLCYGSDTDKMYIVRNTALVEILNNSTAIMDIGSGQIYKAADGKVGIGTSSVDAKLTVIQDQNAQSWIRERNSDAGSSASIGVLLGNNNSAAQGALLVNSTANTTLAGAGSVNLGTYAATALGLFTSNTERMRIDSSGNVGIGGTPVTKFDVFGNTTLRGTLDIQTSSVIQIWAGNTYGAYNLNNGTVQGAVALNAGRMELRAITNHPMEFLTNNTVRMTIAAAGSVSIVGALSKGSGSFKINHPLPEKKDTHHLVHSFIEGPKADNIYRGKATLVNGVVNVNLDIVSNMTEGTFILLNRDVQCFTTNESDWDSVRGSISGNILTIECENPTSSANISWLVMGERQDQHMYETDWTDEDGRVIVEPEKLIIQP